MLGYLLSMFGGLLAYSLFLNIKGKSAEALLNNSDVKDELSKLDAVVTQNNVAEQAQQQVRTEIQTNLTKAEVPNEDLNSLKSDIDKLTNTPK